MGALKKGMVAKGIAAARELRAKPASSAVRAYNARELAADFVAESQSLETNAAPIDRRFVMSTETDKR